MCQGSIQHSIAEKKLFCLNSRTFCLLPLDIQNILLFQEKGATIPSMDQLQLVHLGLPAGSKIYMLGKLGNCLKFHER